MTKRVLTYVFLIIMSIIFAFPFYFLIVSATNVSMDVTSGRLLPGAAMLENWQKLIEQTDLITAFTNSSIIAFFQTILSLLIGSMAGYGFEIYRSKMTDFVFNVLLASMMIPFAALIIPLFQLFGLLSRVSPLIGINSYASVYLPYISTAFLIFFFRQNTKMFSKRVIRSGAYRWINRVWLVL